MATIGANTNLHLPKRYLWLVQAALLEPYQQAIQAHSESQLVDSLRYCSIKSNKSGSTATPCLVVQNDLETKRKQQKRADVRSSHKHGGTDGCLTVSDKQGGRMGEDKQQRLKRERK